MHKAFQQNVLNQLKFILWFFGLESCKDDSYMQIQNLFIKEIPKNHVLQLLKNPVTVEWFLSHIPYFCDKSKEYLDLNQSSNLETCFVLGLIL